MKHRSDWEYSYFNPFVTNIERWEYKRTGEKRDMEHDYLTCYVYGIFALIFGILMQTSNSYVYDFIKVPLIVIGVIFLLLGIICTVIKLSERKQ